MIKPAGYRLLVKPDEVQEVSEGGIYIVQDIKLEEAAQTLGVLHAIGPTAWKDVGDGTPWAKEGDRVYYARYSGKNVEDPTTGERYILLNDQDITAVITAEGE